MSGLGHVGHLEHVGHELVLGWWQWMATMSVQVAFLVLIVALLDSLLSRWVWPQLRAALWLLVVVKLLLPPTVSSPVSVSQLAIQSGVAPAWLAPPVLAPATLAPAAASGWSTLACVAWLAGVVVLGTLLLLRYLRLRRTWLRAPTLPEPAWLQPLVARAAARIGCRVPALRLVSNLHSPALLGFWRPIIVLPATLLREADRQRIEHVLLHELAHIQRRDPLLSLVCILVQLAYWFHPLVWLTRRRLATLREICCDQTVAQVLQSDTPEYRRTLLELARPMVEPAPGLSFLHGHSQLLIRLAWLQRPPARHPRLRRLVTATTVAALLVCCVPLAHPGTAPPDSDRSRLATDTARVAPGIPGLKSGQGLEDLKGCLQLRYAVHGLLAQQPPDHE